jgi:triosephosphate isomerase (TIM)
MIFLSLKTYREATGQAVINLLSSVKKVSQETGIPIISIAQPTDIYRIKKELDIEVWAQHVDPIDPGRNFGLISPFSVKESGASGIAINHSERPIDLNTVEKTILKAKEYSLKTLVIAQTIDMAVKIADWKPDYILFEDPTLIAGKVSMIDQQKEKIKELLNKISVPLIIGAGISSKEDVINSIKIGVVGVGLATAFVKSENPEAKLRELAERFIKK